MAKRDRCPLLIVAAAAAVVYTLTGFQPGFPASMVQAEEKASVAASSAAREKQAAPTADGNAEERQAKAPSPADSAAKAGQETGTAASAAPGTKPESKPAASADAPEANQGAESAAPEEKQETKSAGLSVADAKQEMITRTMTPSGYVRTLRQDRVPTALKSDWSSYRRYDAPVDASYFSDALFIGDSRTVGLSEYCSDLDEQATFYSKVSLTVKAALDKAFVKTEDGKKSVDELLSDERQFRKIYVMLGINEIGGGTAESFREDYGTMLKRIREKQPAAIIIIQSIMHVTAKKGSGDRHINNTRINERNAAIAELADPEQGIFYLDINEALDDGNGDLDAALSFDGVHLKAASYQLWYDYLRTHAYVSTPSGGGDA